MIRKTILAFALAVSLAALAATLLARPSGAAHRKHTVAFLTYANFRTGGNEAAKRLGVRILSPDTNCHGPGQGVCTPQDVVRLYESMIARHVDAIVVDGFNPTLKPTFKKVRRAGILLISSGDDIAAKRNLWVSQSDPVAYGEALADALASQIGKNGEYAILDERGEYPIVHTWVKVVEHYIPRAYPKMKLDGVQTETGGGDQNEVDAVKRFMATHPNLKGLIGIVPTEAYMAGEAITQAGRIGQVFSAGNGGNSLSDPQLLGYVRTGAAELVYASDLIKQGYLTVWAANYLLTGHRFRPGAYQVGGPIDRVWYYAKHQELRVGQPLTITKKNVDQYANKF